MAPFTVGDVIAERTVHLTRESLVRYAGASGDFNPIHYRDDVAAAVGLPGVLAHGMLTMGLASSVVLSALPADARVVDYGVPSPSRSSSTRRAARTCTWSPRSARSKRARPGSISSSRRPRRPFS